MATLGLIFSNIHDKEIFEVTKNRTIASAPIGGRYRLIDFTLSNMVNNGITHIGVVTKNNYLSLMDHVGSGKEWDLARKNGGLVILPPYGASQELYNSRLEALKSIISFIKFSRADYIVLADCYQVCNIDYKPIFQQHFETKADITCVYRESDITTDDYSPVVMFDVNHEKRIVGINIQKKYVGRAKVSIDTWIIKKTLLESLVVDAIAKNLKSFNRDILRENLGNLNICGYKFDGFFGNISSLNSYFQVNMNLLNESVRDELFNSSGRSIYTKIRDSAPTKYGTNAKISNSLIADGCIIDGTVENSIVFRGCKINKSAVVKNSILMQSTIVDDNANLDYVITDKNVKILNEKQWNGSVKKLIYIEKDGVR
jgi:glucose-1-phosphate adenylyltransferase